MQWWKQGMNANKLKLNEDKTELFIAASNKHNFNFLNNITLNICDSTITPSTTVPNLEVNFDQHMDMSAYVSSMTSSLNFQLRNIGRIRRY